MPFPDRFFDTAMVGFGIRNVESIPRAVAETLRVLKPGGLFLTLEFSRPAAALVCRPYHLYLRHVLPRLGGWLTGRRAAYQYLADSIRAFPDQQNLCRLFREAGCRPVEFENLSGGIVAVHAGFRPQSGAIPEPDRGTRF